MSTGPAIWQLVREAAEHFNREVAYSELKQFVWTNYPDVNSSTLTCQIIVCSVNHPSRIHYPENKKPRPCSEPPLLLRNQGGNRNNWSKFFAIWVGLQNMSLKAGKFTA